MKRIEMMLIGALVTLPAASVRADRIAPNRSPVQQALHADIVVIGTVTELANELVSASVYPGGPAVGTQIVTIKVAEDLRGAKGMTHVRVGLFPVAKAQRDPRQPLALDQSGCFFLKKHHNEDFYVQDPLGLPLYKTAADFEERLAPARKVLEAIKDPLAALKANKPLDRQIAACALVTVYRRKPITAPHMQVALENVPVEESKLILATLAEMDWRKADASGVVNVLSILPLLDPNGYRAPKPVQGQDYNMIVANTAAKWFKENASTFQIQRYVVIPKK